MRNRRASTSNLPEKIRPFEAWGCDMERSPSDEWIGDCLLCGKEKHFYVSEKTGQWDCKVCGENGNVITFLTKFSEMHAKDTARSMFAQLSKQRGIPISVLKKHGLGFDGEQWLVPMRSTTDTVRDIQRFDGKALWVTPGCKQQLFGAYELANAKAGTRVWNLEGYWDAAAMRAILDTAKKRDDIVTSVPGASIFKTDWQELFEDMDVVVVRDNDEAGDKGQIKALKALRGTAHDVKFVNWPQSRPSGYDLRDFYRERREDKSGEAMLREIISLMSPEPRLADEVPPPEAARRNKKPEGPRIPEEDLGDLSFDDVVREMTDNGILMNEDLKDCLAACIATVISMRLIGATDPVWLYVVGPPSSGKTLLLTAFQAVEGCTFRSSLGAHSLVSGWKEDERGRGRRRHESPEEDPSLIWKLSGGVLVIKDGTEILSLPEAEQRQIFGVLRGAYDGYVHRSYGNGVERRYDKHSDPPFLGFGCLCGVTPIIHKYREAALGERFLKFNLREPSDDWTEAVNIQALDNIGKERDAEDRVQWAVTSFVVSCQHRIDELLKSGKGLPKWPDTYKKRLNGLVRIVAILRSNADKDWRTGEYTHRVLPEAGTRLMKQLGKMGYMLCIEFGRSEIDEFIWKKVKRMAFDTCYGFHADIIDEAMKQGGTTTRQHLSAALGIPLSTVSRRMEDLAFLGIVTVAGKGTTTPFGGKPPTLYTVTERVAGLWRQTQVDRSQDQSKRRRLRRKKGADQCPTTQDKKRKRLVRRT